jgi:hypothetical protein
MSLAHLGLVNWFWETVFSFLDILDFAALMLQCLYDDIFLLWLIVAVLFGICAFSNTLKSLSDSRWIVAINF